jgi:hypothetical protein
MFHDLAVIIESEDIDVRSIILAWPCRLAVQDNVLPLSDHALEVNVLPRILLRHPQEVLDEALLPISHAGIVLDVCVPYESLNGFNGPTLVNISS